MPQVFYTENEYITLHDKYRCTRNLFQNIFQSVKESDRAQDNKYFTFIPQEFDRVYEHFTFLRDYLVENFIATWNFKFLDVGCGAGNIILIAKEIFSLLDNNIHGIEYNKKLVDIAKQLISFNPKIFNVDAFDFKKYRDYDIIYYYRPIEDWKLEKKLERLIEKSMKKNTFLIPFLKKDYTLLKNKSFEKLDNDFEIYRKL